MIARLRQLAGRARHEGGFGLVELIAAMVILLVGLLAVFAMFEAGIVQLRRASTVSTAGALADAEMEKFRAIRYDSIGLAEADVAAAPSPYSTDAAYEASASDRVDLPVCGTAPCTTKVPTQTLTGADGRSYRVDMYVTWQTTETAPSSVDGSGGALGTPAPIAGRNVKLVTIVVRDSSDTSKVWARVASSFDESTGQ